MRHWGQPLSEGCSRAVLEFWVTSRIGPGALFNHLRKEALLEINGLCSKDNLLIE